MIAHLSPSRGPLRGSLRLPGDKSISHRSVMLASVSHGESLIHGFLEAADTLSTVDIFRALGVSIEIDGGVVKVQGRGKGALRPSAAPLDCGNSGTTIRLVTGLLAGLGLPSVLVGDDSLSRRPMGRIADPLRAFGGRVETSPGGSPPLTVGDGAGFEGGHYRSPLASAQVKSSLLLAALMAGVPMEIEEPHASRDHTETMLRSLGVPVVSSAHYQAEGPCDGLARVSLPAWSEPLAAQTVHVPGDISSAAFVAVAAAIVPGSQVVLQGCGVAPTRAGLIKVLGRATDGLVLEGLTRGPGGELSADLHLSAGPLRAFDIEAHEVPTLIDEIPVLAVMAAQAHGRSEFRGVGELRVKESDRLSRTASLLTRCGVTVETGEDWLAIEGLGGEPFEAFEFEAPHDHRMAAASAVASLVAKGPCRVEGMESLSVSYPALLSDLDALQAEQEERA